MDIEAGKLDEIRYVDSVNDRLDGDQTIKFKSSKQAEKSVAQTAAAGQLPKEIAANSLDANTAEDILTKFFASDYGAALLEAAADQGSFREFAAAHLLSGGQEDLLDPEILSRVDALGATIRDAKQGDFSAFPQIATVDTGGDFVAYSSAQETIILEQIHVDEQQQLEEMIAIEIGHWMSHRVNGDVDQTGADGAAFDEGDAVFRALGGVISDDEIHSEDHESILLSLNGGPAVETTVERRYQHTYTGTVSESSLITAVGLNFDVNAGNAADAAQEIGEELLAYLLADSAQNGLTPFATLTVSPTTEAGIFSVEIFDPTGTIAHVSAFILTVQDISPRPTVATELILDGNLGDAYVLYRPDSTSEWVQIGRQEKGVISPNGEFDITLETDLSTGEYALVSGNNLGMVHPSVGTSQPVPDAVIGTYAKNQAGGQVTFVGVDNSTSVVNLIDERLVRKRPFAFVPPPNDDEPAATADIPVRTYRATYDFTFEEERTLTGFQGNRTEYQTLTREITVTITPEMTVSAATATATGLTEGASILTGLTSAELKTWADHLSLGVRANYDRDPGDRWSVHKDLGAVYTGITTTNPYQREGVKLIGVGETVSAAPGTTPVGSTFWLQGDNEIESGFTGDSLGRITFESYPADGGQQRLLTDADGDIVLTSAYAVNANGNLVEDLSDEFYIRPTFGLDGQFELGLEAGNTLYSQNFPAGISIALEIEAIDKNGNVFTTIIYFDPSFTAEQPTLTLVNTLESTQEATGALDGSGAAFDPAASYYQSPAFTDAIAASGDFYINAVVAELAVGTAHLFTPTNEEANQYIRNNATITDATASINIDGGLVTHLGIEENFPENNYFVVGRFDGTVDVTREYEVVLDTLVGDPVHRSSFMETKTFANLGLSANMSVEDQAFFNEHFEIVQSGGSYLIVQTQFVESLEPREIELDIMIDGEGTRTVSFILNENNITVPGRSTEYTIDNPELVDSTALPIGLVGDALLDDQGNAAVQIAGLDLTPEVLTNLIRNLSGLLPNLIEDETAIRALLTDAGLTADEIDTTIRQLKESQALHTSAAIVPGMVVVDPAVVPLAFDILESAVGDVALNDFLSAQRDIVVSDEFGANVDAPQVAREMLTLVFELEIDPVTGLFTDTFVVSPLLDELAGLTEVERNQFISSWIAQAILVDGDTVGPLIEQIQNDPTLVAQQSNELINDVVTKSFNAAGVLADKFAAFWVDGEMTDAEIDEFLADDELVELFLMSLQATVQLDPVLREKVSNGTIVAGTGEALGELFRFLVLGDLKVASSEGVPFTANLKNGLKAALRGTSATLLSVGAGLDGGFKEETFVPTMLVQIFGTGQFALNNDLITEFTEDSKDPLFRPNPEKKLFGIQTFFALGKVASLSSLVNLTEDATPIERAMLTINALSAVGSLRQQGTLSGVFGLLASYFETGDSAYQYAQSNKYYMTEIAEDGRLTLVGATIAPVEVRDPTEIADLKSNMAIAASITETTVTDPNTKLTTTTYTATVNGQVVDWSKAQVDELIRKMDGKLLHTDAAGVEYVLDARKTRDIDQIDAYNSAKARVANVQTTIETVPVLQTDGTPLLQADGSPVTEQKITVVTNDAGSTSVRLYTAAEYQADIALVSNNYLAEDALGQFLSEKRYDPSHLLNRSRELETNASAGSKTFRMDKGQAAQILATGKGNQFTIIEAPSIKNSFTVDDIMWNKAIAEIATEDQLGDLNLLADGSVYTLNYSDAGGLPQSVMIAVTNALKIEVAQEIAVREVDSSIETAVDVLEKGIGADTTISGTRVTVDDDLYKQALNSAFAKGDTALDVLSGKTGTVVAVTGLTATITVDAIARTEAINWVLQNEPELAREILVLNPTATSLTYKGKQLVITDEFRKASLDSLLINDEEFAADYAASQVGSSVGFGGKYDYSFDVTPALKNRLRDSKVLEEVTSAFATDADFAWSIATSPLGAQVTSAAGITYTTNISMRNASLDVVFGNSPEFLNAALTVPEGGSVEFTDPTTFETLLIDAETREQAIRYAFKTDPTLAVQVIFSIQPEVTINGIDVDITPSLFETATDVHLANDPNFAKDVLDTPLNSKYVDPSSLVTDLTVTQAVKDRAFSALIDNDPTLAADISQTQVGGFVVLRQGLQITVTNEHRLEAITKLIDSDPVFAANALRTGSFPGTVSPADLKVLLERAAFAVASADPEVSRRVLESNRSTFVVRSPGGDVVVDAEGQRLALVASNYGGSGSAYTPLGNVSLEMQADLDRLNKVARRPVSALTDQNATDVLTAGNGGKFIQGGVLVEIDEVLFNRATTHVASDAANAVSILSTDIGQTFVDPTTTRVITITQELKDAAIVSQNFDVFKDAAVGDVVDVVAFTDPTTGVVTAARKVVVTEGMLEAVEAKKAATGVGQAFTSFKDIDINSRLSNIFFGADSFLRASDRLGQFFKGVANTDELAGLARYARIVQNLGDGTNLGHLAAGTLNGLNGVTKVLGGSIDFVTLAIDIWATVNAFKEGDSRSQKFAVTNLILGAIGTVTTLGVLAGKAAIGPALYAALGPVGAVLAVATVAVFLAEEILREKTAKELDIPQSEEEVFEDFIDFLRGDNEFGVDVLAGLNVVYSDEFDQVEFDSETQELRIPKDELIASDSDIAKAIAEAFENGDADWLTNLITIYHQSQPAERFAHLYTQPTTP